MRRVTRTTWRGKLWHWTVTGRCADGLRRRGSRMCARRARTSGWRAKRRLTWKRRSAYGSREPLYHRRERRAGAAAANGVRSGGGGRASAIWAGAIGGAVAGLGVWARRRRGPERERGRRALQRFGVLRAAARRPASQREDSSQVAAWPGGEAGKSGG